MKRIKSTFILPITAFSLLVQSCNLLDDPSKSKDSVPDQSDGISYLSCKFNESALFVTKAGTTAKLDTNSFILTITSESGESIYCGNYGAAPEKFSLDAGTYCVNVVSEEFDVPRFDAPQWGDEQYVVVQKGKNVMVELLCRQMNCGVRLKISSSFLTDYPSSALFLKSAEGGLMYGYSERRTAYFSPGPVRLVLSTGAKDEVLLTRSLLSSEILNLEIQTSSAPSSSGSGLKIAVDTTRSYLSEVFVLGGGSYESSKGSSADNAYTVSQARSAIGQTGVWVGGYIVGGDLTSKSMSVEPPFSSASNFALGPKSGTKDKSACISVSLPSGKAREALNLVSHPDNLGRYVYLKGDIVSAYFGIVGLKEVSDFVLK